MPLSDSARAVMEQLARLPPPPDFATITPEQAAVYLAESRAATAVAKPGEPVAKVLDWTVDGSGCRARGYVPATADARGVVVHFHGGGWVTGSIEMSDEACRYFANRCGCAVLSAGYRLAPEHPFPAALDDATAALRWARTIAPTIGADGTRVVVVGTSAGATLAAAACLVARDQAEPLPQLQVLIYPPLDASGASPSYRDNGSGYYLTADQMRWFWRTYAGNHDTEDPYLSPLHAARLEGLPPAVIITAEFDPLRDDGARYAGRLRDARVAVELECVPGQIHSFMGMVSAVPEARQCWDRVADRVRSHLA